MNNNANNNKNPYEAPKVRVEFPAGLERVYVAPVVEVLPARVERGFAGSACNTTPVDHCQIEGWANEDAIFF